jgi:hypothetical protein
MLVVYNSSSAIFNKGKTTWKQFFMHRLSGEISSTNQSRPTNKLSRIIERDQCLHEWYKNEVSTSLTRIRLVISNHHLSLQPWPLHTSTDYGNCDSEPWISGDQQTIVKKREGLSNRFSRPETHFHHKSINWLSAQCGSSTTRNTWRRRTLRFAVEGKLQSAMSKSTFRVKMKTLRIQICRHLDFCPSDGNSSIWFGRYHLRKQQTLGDIVPCFNAIGLLYGIGVVLMMSVLIGAKRKKMKMSKNQTRLSMITRPWTSYTLVWMEVFSSRNIKEKQGKGTIY